MKSFWVLWVGKFVCWCVYIFLGFVVFKFLELVLLFFFVWFFCDVCGFVIVGIFFGGVVLILIVGCLYY